MEEVKLIAEILKYILPALAVMGGVYMTLQYSRKQEAQKESMAIRGQAMSKMVPLRLQAYERAVLFLERISPENLLMRLDYKGMSTRQFWKELQLSVREEYEHNMAQQLYISPDAWKELKLAKEAVLTLINTCGKSTPPNAPALDLARKILVVNKEAGDQQTQSAIQFLKEDIQRSFKLIK